MTRRVPKGVKAGLLAIVLLAGHAATQARAPKSSSQSRKLPQVETPEVPLGPATLPAPCEQARERALALLAELEARLSPQAKTAAERYVATPGPGGSPEKAWGDYAAAALLMGDLPVAAWAGVKAAIINWNGGTVTNAGIYLIHLGKLQDALHLLNCAYAMGYRSPFLLEALAVVHHKLGEVGPARQAIQQAGELAPDDRIIETETSFMTTGQPPPPPDRSDALDDALRELEEHAQVALNLMKLQADEIDRDLPSAEAGKFYQIDAEYFPNLIKIARDRAQQTRALPDPTRRQDMINGVLSLLVSDYAAISDKMLTFPDDLETNGSSLLLWAAVLGLDPAALARESHRTAIEWSMHGGGPALAQGAYDDYRRDVDAARKEHSERVSGGRDDADRVRENARFCGVWKSLYERWENASRQRYNTAALNFDRIATRYVIQAENESLQSRDYAVRQLKKMLFPKMQGGANLEELTVKGINIAIRNLYEHHLSSAGRTRGTVAYLRERAEWFQSERNEMDEMLGQEANDIQRECESALRALLELLAQEEWQAYLDHLKDRLAWDIQPQTEEEFPCEGSIGYLSVSTDVNELGSGKGKFDLKWKPKLYENKDYNTKVSGSVGVSIGVGGQANEFPSISGKGEYGPFSGKAKVTLTNKVNPWNNQEYTGIKLKGSAGFGLSAGKKVKLGVACYPSSGSVTLYPRALYEDAVKYLSTPSTPPSGGRH